MARNRTLVEISPELAAAIDELVGPRKRSAFVAELAEQEVRRQRFLRVLSSEEPLWKEEDHPELANGVEVWVRQMREENEGRFRREMGLDKEE